MMNSSAAPLSLDEWYVQYAPLSDAQRMSVSRLSAWVSADEPGAPTEATQAIDESEGEQDGLNLNFSCWLHSVTKKHEDASRTTFANELGMLRTSMNEIEERLDDVHRAQERIVQLRTGLEYVQESSSELMHHASALLNEQVDLESLHEQIMLRLQYFSVLPQVTAILSETDAHVETAEFLSTIERLCVALQFMECHPRYKDTQVFRIRIENALQRAMSLVKQAFQREGNVCMNEAHSKVRALAKEALDAGTHTSMNPTAPSMHQAIYASFASLQPKFQAFFEHLRQLANQKAEFRDIQHEFDSIWIRWRTSLIHDAYAMCLNAFCDNVPLEQQLRHATYSAHEYHEHEMQLFLHVNARTSDNAEPVNRILQTVGEQLQAWLSQRIETAPLNVLSQLCTIVVSYGGEAWCEPVLRDLSTRMEKSATMLLKTDIIGYSPSTNDLDASAIRARRTMTTTTTTTDTLTTFAAAQQPRTDAYATWYAPVRTVYDILHTLHTRVPAHNFVHITLKCIEACEAQVRDVSKSMQDGKFGGDDGDAADALLFSWRHYRVLRELLHLAEKQLSSDRSGGQVISASHTAMQSLWTVTGLMSASDDQQALRTMREHLDTLIEHTVTEVGAFMAASLALPLQIYERQSIKTPSRAFAAWETFQQSLDVNLDAEKRKIQAYVHADDVPILVQAILAPLRATYETFLSSLTHLSATDANDLVTAQKLRTLQRTDELQVQLAQRFAST